MAHQLDPIACADEDCCEVFVPKLPQRVYCYNPECKERRLQRTRRAWKAKVRLMKVDGRIKGIGNGRYERMDKPKPYIEGGTIRHCLKCDKVFTSPVWADFRICDTCHGDNDILLREYDEDALGLNPTVRILGGN